MSDEIKDFYTEKASAYETFISLFRYSQGLRAYWMKSEALTKGLRVLDAGCGTGAMTLAFLEALEGRGLTCESIHAFDLTPAMLQKLRAKLEDRGIDKVELHEANVLELEALPETWRGYDLLISASMLEYIPRDRFVDALRGLRSRLKDGGSLILVITRDNWLMRLLIGGPWRSNLYTRTQLEEAFQEAGFAHVAFGQIPLSHGWLRLWPHIVEAKNPAG